MENHLHSVFHLLLCQTEMGSLGFSALLHSAWQENMCQLAMLTLRLGAFTQFLKLKMGSN